MSLSVGKIVLLSGLAFLLATGSLLTGAGKIPHAARAAELPDLVPTALTAPDTVVIPPDSASIEVSWTVANQGTADAWMWREWADSLYLSTDNTFDGADTYLGGVRRGSRLAPGSSYTATKAVSIPQAASGSYYLLVRTGVWGESNEANNVLSRPITIKVPDLVPTALTAPDTAVTQQRIEVSWTVSNQGMADATMAPGHWGYDQLYLSTERDQLGTKLTAEPGFPTYGPIYGLAASKSYTATKTVPIPGVPAGSYYLVVRTDDFGSLYESDEANNVLARPITIKVPDLVPTAFTAPDTMVLRWGNTYLDVSWTVANQGTGDAGVSGVWWGDYLYFSADSIWDRQDTKLTPTYAYVSSYLAVGSSYTATKTVGIPDVAEGSYYLLVYIDGLSWAYTRYVDQLYESNEDNNVLARAITVTKPDLVPTALTAPDIVVTQHSPIIEVSWTVANQGTGDALAVIPWYDYVYLSTDNIIDEQDTLLADTSHPSDLAVGGSYDVTTTVNIADVDTAAYYLLVSTDIRGLLPETNEDNNVMARVITITAPDVDLMPAALTAPDTVLIGQQVEVSWTVANQGTVDAMSPWSDKLYLSADNAWDEPDTYLAGATRNSGLAAGDSYDVTAAVSIPTLPAGSYYLLLRTDTGKSVAESDGDNNDGVRAITVTVSYTLTISITGSGSTTPEVGAYTYPAGTIMNISATPAAGWQFVNWTGEVANPNSAATTVTVDTDKTVTAHFIRVTVPGDANGDGKVDSLDVTAIERIIALLDPPTTGADADADGSLNALDITKTERIVAGLS